jgi:hypothetical protein
MTSAFATLALALGLANAPPDAVSLRWKLNKGDQFYAQSKIDMKQTVGVAGQEIEQTMKQTVTARYKVLASRKDGVTLEQTTLQAKIDTNIPGAGDFADKLKGTTLTFVLDDKHRVTKVEGLDKLINTVSGDDENARKMLKSFLNPDVLRQSVDTMFAFGPAKPVRPGDTWKRDYKYALGPLGTFTVNADYKLAGPTGGLEKVTMTARAKYAPPKAGGDAPLFTVSGGELTAEDFATTYLFDPKAGRLKESRAEMKLSGKLTVSVMGNEVEMDLKQTLKTTTAVSDKNPVAD